MLAKLPPPPPGKTGWPWTEETPQLPDTMPSALCFLPDGRAWPKISIVTPSYNQGQFIEETIRSVLLQGYPNLEYIIIDGGSSDNSVEIIKKYEPWLAYWVSEPDNGQSDAINTGWKQSSGNIVAYLNSDDLYTRGAIAEAIKHLKSVPDCAVVHGQTMLTDDKGNDLYIWGGPFDIFNAINCNNTIAQASVFIRRKALTDVGFLDTNLHLAMDYDLWIRIGVRHSFYFVPSIWSKFRHHNESKSGKNISLRGDCLPALKKLYASSNLPCEILQMKNQSLSWANLFYGQMQIALKRPIAGRWYALKALALSRAVCLKRGNGQGLFIQLVFGQPIFNLIRRVKKLLIKTTFGSIAE